MVSDAQVEAALREMFAGMDWLDSPDIMKLSVAGRMRAALEAAEKAAWKPIGEAPKDGTWFLAFQNGETYPCQFHEEEPEEYAGLKGWLDLFNRSFEEPTMFRPLPTPPEASHD
ncbi:MAG: hypothetical protein ACRCTG_14460 [Aestuariivirga sp.]